MNKIYSVKRFSQQISKGRVILPGNTRYCDPLPTKFTDKLEFQGLRNFVRIETTKKFDKNIQTLHNIARKRIKDLRASIKGGYFYENGDFPNEETHYVSKYSKDGKYHRLTKDIDGHNRLDYIVYPPEVVEDPITKEKYLVTTVVLQNCIGHFDWKNERYYSKLEKK